MNHIRTIYYVNYIIFTHVSKMDSACTSFNINNSNIIKVRAFSIKSWQLLQRYGPNLKTISLKYQKWQIWHPFDRPGLLTSILSEICRILAFYKLLAINIFMHLIHTKHHLRKLAGNVYHLLRKQIW